MRWFQSDFINLLMIGLISSAANPKDWDSKLCENLRNQYKISFNFLILIILLVSTKYNVRNR